MVNRKLKQDLQKVSNKRPSDFWGALGCHLRGITVHELGMVSRFVNWR